MHFRYSTTVEPCRIPGFRAQMTDSGGRIMWVTLCTVSDPQRSVNLAALLRSSVGIDLNVLPVSQTQTVETTSILQACGCMHTLNEYAYAHDKLAQIHDIILTQSVACRVGRKSVGDGKTSSWLPCSFALPCSSPWDAGRLSR